MLDERTKWLKLGRVIHALKATRYRDTWKVMVAYVKSAGHPIDLIVLTYLVIIMYLVSSKFGLVFGTISQPPGRFDKSCTSETSEPFCRLMEVRN